MSRLPRVTARQMLTVLERAGFLIVRTRGSHHFLRHRDDANRTTVIALHPGELPRGTVMDILKQARLSRGQFLDLL